MWNSDTVGCTRGVSWTWERRGDPLPSSLGRDFGWSRREGLQNIGRTCIFYIWKLGTAVVSNRAKSKGVTERDIDRVKDTVNMEETCTIAADLSESQTLVPAVGQVRCLKACNTHKNWAVCKGKKPKRRNPAFGPNHRLSLFVLGALLSLLLVHTWADWQIQAALPDLQPSFTPPLQPTACEVKDLVDYAAAVNGGQVLPHLSSASYHGSLLVPDMQESWGGLNQLSHLIDEDNSQAHCWAFAGQQGYATIQLGKPVLPTRFGLLHANVSPQSAPQVLKRAQTLLSLQRRLHSSPASRPLLLRLLTHRASQRVPAVLPLCPAVSCT